MVCFSSIYIVSVNRVRRNHPQHTHNHIRNFNFFMFHLLLFFKQTFQVCLNKFCQVCSFSACISLCIFKKVFIQC